MRESAWEESPAKIQKINGSKPNLEEKENPP